MTNNTTSTTDNKPLELAGMITQIKSKEGGTKPYLNHGKATTWFYHDHPLPVGRIITNILTYEPLLVRAEIWISGEMVATGHADKDGNSNSLKKVESAAIRRALANAGYGTDQALKQIAKDIGVERSKELLGSGKNKSERKLGGETPTDTRNPIAILTMGLEENGTTLELAGTALRIKDLNDIDEWRTHGSTPTQIAAKVKTAKVQNPYVGKSGDTLFDMPNEQSEALANQFQKV